MQDWLVATWEVISATSGFLYNIAGIALTIGLFIAYKHFKESIKQTQIAQGQLASSISQAETMREDLAIRNKRSSVEFSLQYLSMFSGEVVGEIDEYRKRFKERTRGLDTTKIPLNEEMRVNPDDLSNEQLIESIIMSKCGVHHIANRLEFFSIGILNGLADEDICFTPLAKLYCEFIEEHHLYFSLARYDGVPYEGVYQLYNNWSKRLKYEASRLQKEEAENMMKEHGEFTRITAIGITPEGDDCK